LQTSCSELNGSIVSSLQGLSPKELKSYEEMNSGGSKKKKKKAKEEVNYLLMTVIEVKQ